MQRNIRGWTLLFHLLFTAIHRNTLHHAASRYGRPVTLLSSSAHRNILQRTAIQYGTPFTSLSPTTHCNALHHTATHCDTIWELHVRLFWRYQTRFVDTNLTQVFWVKCRALFETHKALLNFGTLLSQSHQEATSSRNTNPEHKHVLFFFEGGGGLCQMSAIFSQ